jgi:heme-degrading monooxygenase HmoA
MAVQATNTFHTKPGRAGELLAGLHRVLPDTLTHDGCEEVRLWRDQDDQDRVVSATRWTTRADYEAYLEWRSQKGDTSTFREMLTKNMEVHYYDELTVCRAHGSGSPVSPPAADVAAEPHSPA